MDEAQKKPIMIGIIVVCLVVAVAVTIRTWSGGGTGIPKGWKDPKHQVWLKCRNPACKATYEMNKFKYFKVSEDYMIKHNTAIAPPLDCKECGKPAVYAAVKCEKCGVIFEKGWKTGDFQDRCPECEYSSIEVGRRKKAGLSVDE